MQMGYEQKNIMTARGIYIHLPFCLQKCLYCDFASYAGCGEYQEQYVQTVCAEIAERSGEMPAAKAATVYFGGGTPSLLSPPEIERIITALQKNGFWREPAEVTIEANPETVTFEKLQAYRSLGIDRISFGVQSLNDEELRLCGRVHSAAQALRAVEYAQEAGFQRVSLDLIFGLPGQTLASYRNTLRRAVATGVRHISVYGLTIEQGTPLERLLNEGKLTLPEEEESLLMYDFTIDYLAEQGLQRYEISNYAVPGEEARHNITYWSYLPYYGFGSAACSFDGDKRRTNSLIIEDYLSGNKEMEIEVLPPATMLGEFMFLGLRKTAGVSIEEVERRFDVEIMRKFADELQQYLENEYLIYDRNNKRLSLTRKGMQFGNAVFEIFV